MDSATVDAVLNCGGDKSTKAVNPNKLTGRVISRTQFPSFKSNLQSQLMRTPIIIHSEGILNTQFSHNFLTCKSS